MSVLAVIPARGGSKGIKLKNLRKIKGVSLVGRAISTLQESKLVNRIVVSTDHNEIAHEARRYDTDVPFLRPDNISGDRIGDIDVLHHALDASEAYFKEKYEYVAMIQPTSPIRFPDDIDKAISIIKESNYDAVWSVSESDSKEHPFKQLIVQDKMLAYYDLKGKSIIARQQLDKTYHRNGVVYVFKSQIIRNRESLLTEKTFPLVLEGLRVSIDTEWDLELCEYIFNRDNL